MSDAPFLSFSEALLMISSTATKRMNLFISHSKRDESKCVTNLTDVSRNMGGWLSSTWWCFRCSPWEPCTRWRRRTWEASRMESPLWCTARRTRGLRSKRRSPSRSTIWCRRSCQPIRRPSSRCKRDRRRRWCCRESQRHIQRRDTRRQRRRALEEEGNVRVKHKHHGSDVANRKATINRRGTASCLRLPRKKFSLAN